MRPLSHAAPRVAMLSAILLTSCLDASHDAIPTSPMHVAGRQASPSTTSYPDSYIEHSRRVLHGAAVRGGCRFTTRDSMRAGEHVFEWSVAYDPTFCTLTLAQGEYLGPPQTVDGANRTASGSIPVAPASTGTLTLTSRRTTRGGQLSTLDGEVTCDNTLDAAYTAYQHIWIEDPVFLDVASDELWINYFSRPQLNCIQDGSYTHTAWWRRAPAGSSWTTRRITRISLPIGATSRPASCPRWAIFSFVTPRFGRLPA